jgi:K+-transporting ATPase ATPase C chain
MATRLPTQLRHIGAAARALLVLTVVLGVAYPLTMTVVAQLAFPGNADGSLVELDGTTVGSDLIGQSFAADPRYFQSRPSAAGAGYDPLATSASNLGPENSELADLVRRRRTEVSALDGVPAEQVAPDALQASGSGLDPHISPRYAAQQVARVARERGSPVASVQALVDRHTEGRVLGFLGEPRVNVLLLNLALDRLSASDATGG